jgi:hypothetical protein
MLPHDWNFATALNSNVNIYVFPVVLGDHCESVIQPLKRVSTHMVRATELDNGLRKGKYSRAWWHTPLIPALGRQRQVDFWVRGQPGLQSDFQDSQGYTEKPCLKKPKKKKKKKKKKKSTHVALILIACSSNGGNTKKKEMEKRKIISC